MAPRQGRSLTAEKRVWYIDFNTALLFSFGEEVRHVKKAIASLFVIVMLAGLLFSAALAEGGKEHGTAGTGFVKQEDPVGPGIQPDWQD